MKPFQFTIRRLMIIVAIVALFMAARIWANTNRTDFAQLIRQYLEPKLGKSPDAPASPN